jgi:hypothetical protein
MKHTHTITIVRDDDYSLFLRRDATAADNAANPVPKSTTVIGSGIGTGPGGEIGGTGVDVTVAGGKITTCVGVLVSVGIGTPVFVGVGVGVGVGVSTTTGVFVDVGDGNSVAAVSVAAGASCANAELDVSQPGNEIIANRNKTVAKTTSCVDEVRFIVRFSPHGFTNKSLFGKPNTKPSLHQNFEPNNNG